MDVTYAVFGAVGAWDAGFDDGLELHGVEMPPGPLFGMIFERTRQSTLGAAALAVGVVLEVDFDALGFEIEVDGLDEPVFAKTEQQGVMLIEIVHATILLKASVKNQPKRPQPR